MVSSFSIYENIQLWLRSKFYANDNVFFSIHPLLNHSSPLTLTDIVSLSIFFNILFFLNGYFISIYYFKNIMTKFYIIRENWYLSFANIHTFYIRMKWQLVSYVTSACHTYSKPFSYTYIYVVLHIVQWTWLTCSFQITY